MEKILVPTDLSAHSELALQYAIDMGLNDKAQIILFNDAIKEEELEQANQGLEKAASEIKKQHNSSSELTIETKSTKGPVLEGISKMIREEKYDLISMLTHEDEGIDHTIGSISTKIAQKGKAPSLLVPENNTYKKIQNILIVNDFSDSRSDEPAFKHLGTLLQKISAKAFLLEAVSQQAKTEKEENHTAIMGSVQPADTDKKSFETYQELISQIKEYVSRYDIQMIYLPSGQVVFEKIFVGNFARKLALSTKTPVYIYF